MSSSFSSPEATPSRDVRSNTTAPDASPNASPEPTPDYVGLVRFLIRPFLTHPEALEIDCERSQQRLFIRVAVDDRDRGRACGRGGRNIDAIRHVLSACATVAGEVVRLEMSGGVADRDSPDSRGDRRSRPQPSPNGGRRTPPPKPRLRRDRPPSSAAPDTPDTPDTR